MKRKLLTLSALFCSAFIVMFILVRGAEPDRIFTSASRHYDIFQLHPLDTIAFPGRVSIMHAAQGNVYGYVYSKTAIFRFNTHTHMLDTFFSNSQLSLPIITRMEIDTAAGKFFLFDDTQDHITTYQPLQHLIDSIQYPSAVHTPALPTSTFLTRGYDTGKQVSQLHVRNFSNPSQDSILFDFPHFEDGGLSADGFFVHSPHMLFYIPFYNAGIIRYDAIKHQLFQFQTLDQTPPVNIAVPTGNIYSRSSKAVVVNSTATADDQHLFVLSYVLSQDVVKSNYRGPAVDVYRIADGAYEGSFRLPGYKDKPVLQLAKCNDTLIAAYEKNILLFKLSAL